MPSYRSICQSNLRCSTCYVPAAKFVKCLARFVANDGMIITTSSTSCCFLDTVCASASWCCYLITRFFSLSVLAAMVQGKPDLASFIEAKDDGSGGNSWSYKYCKVPVKSSPPINQHPTFYRPDALPVAQSTVSKHWRENITFHGLAHPKLAWGLPTLTLTTNSSWLPWWRVAMPLISPLMAVPQ